GLLTLEDRRCNYSGAGPCRAAGHTRLWFAEYGGNAIAVFDPKTTAIKEYQLPTKFGAPYDVVPNKDSSQVWTGSMLNDRVARLDTRSGQMTEYLLPRSTNIRRVFVQENRQKTMLWVGSNHGASIVKVEPRDCRGPQSRKIAMTGFVLAIAAVFRSHGVALRGRCSPASALRQLTPRCLVSQRRAT